MDFEKYLDKAIELGNKAVEQHGQQAWDTVLFITQLEAVSCLVLAFFSLLNTISFAVYVKKTYKMWYEKESLVVVAFTWGCTALVTTLIFLIVTLNVWTWVALLKPELYLAKQALDAVIK